MSTKGHHNTTKESGQLLFCFEAKAQKQQEKILEFMKLHPRQRFSPFDVYRAIFNDKTPVTSVRRAITNLEKAGYLIKTGHKVMETLGRPNDTWIFNSNKI